MLCTVFNSVFQHKLSPFLRCFPPRGNATTWRLAAEFSELLVGFIQNRMLLFNGQLGRVLMRISMKTDFVACVSDHGTFFGEGLERMARDIPCRLDVVIVEEL